MIIKFIECIPVSGKENAFSQAQEAWKSVSECNGFISQYGGWDNNSSNAVVLSLWHDQRSVNEFMLSVHDDIAEKNSQYQTYLQCTVHYLAIEQLIANSGYINPSDVGFIRIADCKLKQNGKQHFFKDQQSIWNPLMSSCSGMLGGYIAKFNEEPDRYMVISFWQDQQSHSQYITNQFQIARNQVNLNAYVDCLASYQIPAVKSWGFT
jgi:heme-degrading monooxygenase HmoA